ncbi:MAG: cellulase family glycosylhydrolase [Phycisphaerae bacterium]|jgi:hypothetical protein
MRWGWGILLSCGPWAWAGDATAAEFVTRAGDGFVACGQPFRFVGFNLRGICHYGRGDILPYSYASDVAANLDYAVSAGARVIRLFAACDAITPQQTGDRLGAVLDACEARGLYALIALTDVYTTGFSPKGDGPYYTVQGSGGLVLLNHAFYAGGYTVNYLPQAVYLADRFKNHKAVFAWQLGNELRDVSSGSTFVSFCQNVTAALRSADPNHMVSAGLIGRRQSNVTFSQALQIYAGLDFVGTHNYNGSDFDDDGDVAGQLGLPYVVDEAGFAQTAGPARAAATDADVAKWLARGVDGYMQWGLMASSYDNGDGDRMFGVDPVFHAADFLLYRDLYAGWAAALAPPGGLSVSPTELSPACSYRTSPPDDVLTVRYGGGGSAAFTVSESVNWLSVSPQDGSAGCAATPVVIRYDTRLMMPGTYQAAVHLDGAAAGTATVQITLTITGMPGDMDDDGDIDMEDFGLFQTCLTGRGLEQPAPECQRAKYDQDEDVDQGDVAKFIGCLSGPNRPAIVNCLK